MCVRFYIDEKIIKTANLITDIPFKESRRITFGDIHPSEYSLVIRHQNRRLIAEEMQWGFPAQDKKLLINARAESAFEKKSFSDSIRYRRCVIPAGKFYEWDQDKVMNTFRDPDNSILYMAGIYDMFDSTPRFTILTTEANKSMKPVHDRMPLIFPESKIREWVNNDRRTQKYLSYEPLLLSRTSEFEQMSLMDFI